MTLRLDLVHPEPRPCRLAWVLLALGLAATAWAGWRHQAESRELASAQAALAAYAPRTAARAATRPGARDMDSPLASQARRALKADWAGLLDGLERQRPAAIAYLSLEADPVRGTLGLHANAKDLPALLAYLGTLPGAGVAQPRLESHTAMEGDGESFVEFRAQALWSQARGGNAP